ncbi:FadR/GntR family transcriptional regulator [Nocardioides sp. B-3]|uniref:FadR/GntR family transcriptional regulator n=1 Tax=Nocardioides sp. B-3 TaxID=2895565 RepID=UPI00215277D5|nr:FCD domain-containing protein [Nocardioides sp. B-3]UUZ59005.1 FCD domain-containing protein [Nocardioides sp. B-3]
MPTAHATVLGEVGPRIVRGDLVEGAVITPDWIGETYGVSRTVAREVVQVLVSMGPVESRRRTGIRILPRAQWDDYDPAIIRWRLDGVHRLRHLHELAELRAAIEPASAALAATHADAEQRAEIVRIAEQMEVSGAAGDLQTFLEQDIEFHRLLLRASGNVMFSGLGDVVEGVLRGRTEHDLMPKQPKRGGPPAPPVVAEAVAGGEADVARYAMTAIVAEVVSDLGHPR